MAACRRLHYCPGSYCRFVFLLLDPVRSSKSLQAYCKVSLSRSCAAEALFLIQDPGYAAHIVSIAPSLRPDWKLPHGHQTFHDRQNFGWQAFDWNLAYFGSAADYACCLLLEYIDIMIIFIKN